MSPKTKLGIGSLVSSQRGSVELPDEVMLLCPRCGVQVAANGQCVAELARVPGESKTGFVVRLIVSCRNCGCFAREPAIPY